MDERQQCAVFTLMQMAFDAGKDSHRTGKELHETKVGKNWGQIYNALAVQGVTLTEIQQDWGLFDE